MPAAFRARVGVARSADSTSKVLLGAVMLPLRPTLRSHRPAPGPGAYSGLKTGDGLPWQELPGRVAATPSRAQHTLQEIARFEDQFLVASVFYHSVIQLLALYSNLAGKKCLTIIGTEGEEAQRLKEVFQHWCRQRGLTQAAELIEQDWDRMVTFYNYPKKQWQHLRTTNSVRPAAILETSPLRSEVSKILSFLSLLFSIIL